MMLAGKVAVVTGGTSGIGYETALGLAGKGAALILVGRDPAKGAAARSTIVGRFPEVDVQFVAGDLTSLSGVRDVAAQIAAQHATLDVLVNNFGGPVMDAGETVDGIERNWAQNFASPFLLTRQLMPLLTASDEARIVNVSTGAMASKLTLDDLEGRGFRAFRAYGEAKLALVAFTNALAARLGETGITGVTANSLHPGVVWTGAFTGSLPRWAMSFAPLWRAMLKNAEQGGATSIFVASDPSLKGVTGRYFNASRDREPKPVAKDPALQSRVWALGERLSGERFDI